MNKKFQHFSRALFIASVALVMFFSFRPFVLTVAFAEENSESTVVEIPPVPEAAKDAEVEKLEQAEEEAEYEAEGNDPDGEKAAPPVASTDAPEKKEKKRGFFGRVWHWLGGGDKDKTAKKRSKDDAKTDETEKVADKVNDAVKEGGEAPETEESQAGIPDLLSPEGDTGTMSPDEFLAEEYRSASRQWEFTDFANQDRALGWDASVFEVPPGLRKRVDFWISIYSKYTTNQGVIHDSTYPEVVYEPVDFSAIMKNTELSDYQKARERERYVKSRRAEIEDRLQKMAGLSSSEGLEGEDLRIWKLWEQTGEIEKLKTASQKGRVRFQLGQKDKFVLGIYYSGRYIRSMEKIFREAGLPIELTRLPFVESSFNIFARSKVGASGVWQFMRRTARPYMMVNKDVDERNDPIEATRASARLLKSNYELLQKWPLAVTGYNHGPYGVRRIVTKTGTTDLSEIVNKYRSRTFGFASENFYSCFLAALEVERNARKYFGDVKWSYEFAGSEIQLKKAADYKGLLAFYDGDENLTRLHNFHLQPSVRRGRNAIPRGTFVRVPEDLKTAAASYFQGAKSLQVALATMRSGASSGKSDAVDNGVDATAAEAVSVKTTVTRSAEALAAAHSVGAGEVEAQRVEKIRPKRYRVRRGDTLSRIARQFRVSVASLKKANDIESTSLRRGQWLHIPE